MVLCKSRKWLTTEPSLEPCECVIKRTVYQQAAGN